MSDGLMDWDAAYRQRGVFDGPPPWNIGEPQPEIEALIRAGKIRSEVLDAGCGVAELSLALAAQGDRVVGVDISATAIAEAKRAAKNLGLTTASFEQGDITSLTGFDGRFNTIIDSTLFHSLPVEARDGYLRSVYRAAASGASYYVLVFAASALPANAALPPEIAASIPSLVTESELREAVSQYWEIDDIAPALIHTFLAGTLSRLPGISPGHYAADEKGRLKVPAFLLTAHKPGNQET